MTAPTPEQVDADAVKHFRAALAVTTGEGE